MPKGVAVLLMVFWRAAGTLGGVLAARWFACVLVAVLVLAAGGCGLLLAGRRGAWASAVTAAALATSPLTGAREVNGKLVAAPLLMLACLGALRSTISWRRPSVQVGWALFCGVAGGSAVLGAPEPVPHGNPLGTTPNANPVGGPTA